MADIAGHLKVLIAGLAEDAVDLAASADGPDIAVRLEKLSALKGLGEDMAALAEAAAILLRRAVEV